MAICFTVQHNQCNSFKRALTESVTQIKKETLAQVFFCEFCEIFKSIFLQRTSPLVASALTGFLTQTPHIKNSEIFRALH